MVDNKYIKQLKDRLRHEPGAKLFLSFAEELRKHDLPDDAVLTLLDGLKKNPGYAAARLTLVRWYMHMDMIPEARQELALVNEVSPLALYAHKRLGLLNRRTGDITGAVEEYKKALEIFPDDRDSLEALQSLESEMPELRLPETEGAYAEDFGPLEIIADDVVAEGAQSGDLEDLGLSLPTMPAAEEAETPVPFFEEAAPVSAVQGDETPWETPAIWTVPEFNSLAEGLAEAEKCLSEGLDRTMRIYDALLASFPGDVTVLGKKKELAAVIRMLGKDKAAAAERLNRLLNAVRTGFSPVKNEPEVVLKRLNSFMERVQLRFRVSGDKKTVLENLNRFSDAIRSRFTEGTALENPA